LWLIKDGCYVFIRGATIENAYIYEVYKACCACTLMLKRKEVSP